MTGHDYIPDPVKPLKDRPSLFLKPGEPPDPGPRVSLLEGVEIAFRRARQGPVRRALSGVFRELSGQPLIGPVSQWIVQKLDR